VTFNTAKPTGYFNLRTSGDPITMISELVARETDILIKRKTPDSDVWTVCKGGHSNCNFNRVGVLYTGNDYRKTWDEVRALTDEFKEELVENGVVVERWWDAKDKKEEIETMNVKKWGEKVLISSVIVVVAAYVLYHRFQS